MRCSSTAMPTDTRCRSSGSEEARSAFAPANEAGTLNEDDDLRSGRRSQGVWLSRSFDRERSQQDRLDCERVEEKFQRQQGLAESGEAR